MLIEVSETLDLHDPRTSLKDQGFNVPDWLQMSLDEAIKALPSAKAGCEVYSLLDSVKLSNSYIFKDEGTLNITGCGDRFPNQWLLY